MQTAIKQTITIGAYTRKKYQASTQVRTTGKQYNSSTINLQVISMKHLAQLKSFGGSSMRAQASKLAIISTSGCPWCKKTKLELDEKNIPFKDYMIQFSPEALATIKGVTGQSTVPQVFIDGALIGGYEDTHRLLESSELQSKLAAARGEGLPASLAQIVEQNAVNADKAYTYPGGFPASEWTALQQLCNKMKEASLGKLVEHKQSRNPFSSKVAQQRQFTSEDVAEWSKGGAVSGEVQGVCDKEGGVVKALYKARLIETVKRDSDKLYRFATDVASKPGTPLNECVEWLDPPQSATDVANELRARILELYDSYLTKNGKKMDYDGLAKDPRFEAYIIATCALQKVDLAPLSLPEKLAFFINIYNALIVHGIAVNGPPDSTVARLKLFQKTPYTIGGHVYSGDDMEHGILRANSTAPASLGALLGIKALQQPIFAADDPRAAFSIAREARDPRIHFALVCGAKSCPAISVYTPANADVALEEAAINFCAGEVQVDVASRTVTMSKIFDWYKGDFGEDTRERLERIRQWVRGEERDKLDGLLAAQGGIKVQYKPYVWDVNK